MSSNLFSDSNLIENSYDPTSRMGLQLEDNLRDDCDPLSMLIACEEQLMAEYGVTFIQAVNEYRKSRIG